MLYTALIFGLLSSFHCVGMCGPIALMLPVDRQNHSRKVMQLLLYHNGRFISYAFLGLLFGALGKGFYLAGMQQQLSIVVGLLMILWVIIPENQLAKYNVSRPVYKLISRVKSQLGAQFKRKSPDAFLTIGLLNGLLPCGMVYAALFGAMAMQSIPLGMGYMVLFGLGTLPMMSAVVLLSQLITMPVRQTMLKIIPVFLLVLGVLFVLRGMGMDIPYISPSQMSLFVQADPNCHP
ncbi:MAG: sulfite exporter TauE/SafE family protein [Flavobacterium sp.]